MDSRRTRHRFHSADSVVGNDFLGGIMSETGLKPISAPIYLAYVKENEEMRQRIAELESDLAKHVAILLDRQDDHKDAERYRWLRNWRNYAVIQNTHIRYDTLDEAIDAAMREDEG